MNKALLTIISLSVVCFSADRGRVKIASNTIVSDIGTLIRGGHIQLDTNASLFSVRLAFWESYRDAKCNSMRVTYDGNGDIGSMRVAPTLSEIIPMLDTAVENASRCNMYIKIEYARNAPGNHPDSTDITDFWNTIAPRYANRTHVFFGIANEPVAWDCQDYDAADVRLQEYIFQLIRSKAPSTLICAWGFPSANQYFKSKVDEGDAIDYSNAAVDYHGYGVLDEREPFWIQCRAAYPIFCGEFTYAPWTNQHESPADVITRLERLGISWSSLCFDGLVPITATNHLWDADDFASPDTAGPSAPAGFEAHILSSAMIKLSWNASTDNNAVSAYHIYRNNSKTAEVTTTFFYDAGLFVNTQYDYKVIAVDAAGNLSGSSEISVTTPGLPVGEIELALNAGGNTFEGSDGITYVADSGFSGGTAVTHNNQISGTEDELLYMDERYGTDFSYNISLANGIYDVIIKLTENYCDTEKCRVFDISAEDIKIVDDLDLYSVVGKNTAYQIVTEVEVADGNLNIRFTGEPNSSAVVNALVIRNASVQTFAQRLTLPVTGKNYTLKLSGKRLLFTGINGKGFIMYIHDKTGRLIARKGVRESRCDMDMSKFAGGSYLVIIKSAFSRQTVPLILQ